MSLRRETTRLPCASRDASTRYSELRRFAGLPVRIPELSRHGVEPPAAKAEHPLARLGRRGAGAHATQDVSQARQQLARIDRFYQVVVGAHFESDDPVHLVAAAREDDQRHVAGGAQTAECPQRVAFTELHRENHQVDTRSFQRARERHARSDAHAEAVMFQVRGQGRARLAFFVTDEHVSGCGHGVIRCIATSRSGSSIRMNGYLR